MAQVRFRATHNFQGDAAHHQLSFSAGNIISVDVKNVSGGEGWVYGTLFGTSRSGWCPRSYLVLQQNNPSAPEPRAAETRTCAAAPSASPTSTNFSDMKVSALRKLCASRGIDTSGMLEKREFVDALLRKDTQTNSDNPSHDSGSPNFSDMKMSALRKLCASRGIDTSGMLEKREFVEALQGTDTQTTHHSYSPPHESAPPTATYHSNYQSHESAPPPTTHAPPPPPAYVYDDDDDESINDGFSGPILGGSATDGQDFRESIHTKDLDTPTNPFA